METRGNFGSKLGIILATAGSAVGLGNIWRFPYMTGQNGGAAFILIYLVCIILLGLPGMLSEFIIGRHSASNAARAYTNLGKHKAWGALGLMGIITSMIIFGFYSVVAGWCLQYLYASIIGGVHGDPEYVKSYFQTFASDPIRPVLWALGFILLTHMLVDAVALLLFKRRVPEKYQAAVNAAGFVVLMGFMLLVTFQDVFKLFR